jgi:hypothetical protein
MLPFFSSPEACQYDPAHSAWIGTPSYTRQIPLLWPPNLQRVQLWSFWTLNQALSCHIPGWTASISSSMERCLIGLRTHSSVWTGPTHQPGAHRAAPKHPKMTPFSRVVKCRNSSKIRDSKMSPQMLIFPKSRSNESHFLSE